MNSLEKELTEAAKEDWRQTKEEERPLKTFIYAYKGNHIGMKTYAKVDLLWKLALVLGIPLVLAFLKYILGF